MRLNTLQRMLLKELLKVFILSLTGLTGLFLLAGLVQEASQRGLSPAQILAAVPLLVPTTLPYTIPTTTLFAVCVVYGRLAHDNEYTAVKSAGVNPLRVLRPAVILGALAGSATMALYYHLIPTTHQLMKKKFLEDSEELLYGVLERKGCLHYRGSPYMMFVREVKGRRLIDVIFKRQILNEAGNRIGHDIIARAREAELRIKPAPGGGKVGVIDMKGRCLIYGKEDSTGNLRDQSFEFPLPAELTGEGQRERPMAMTWLEVRAERAELVGAVAGLRGELERARREVEAAGGPLDPAAAQLVLHAHNLENKLNDAVKRDLNLANEQQMRPALAFGCLCFVLVGCPVGIWFSRSDYLSSFVICFLPVVFAYYPTLLCGSNLGREGKLPLAPAVWFANASTLFWAALLIRRLMRR